MLTTRSQVRPSARSCRGLLATIAGIGIITFGECEIWWYCVGVGGGVKEEKEGTEGKKEVVVPRRLK